MLPSFLLYINIFIFGTQIWIEPSWVSPNIAQQSKFSNYEAQISLARGEEESFQIHILADKDDLNEVSCNIDKLPSEFPEPNLYQIYPVAGTPLPQGGIDRSKVSLDILKPIQPFNLLKGQKTVLWVTLKMPREIKSDFYKTELQINANGKKLKRIPINIEVFDFEVPDSSSLPAISFLDWQTLALVSKQSVSSSEFWINLFKFLYDKRITTSLGTYLQTNSDDLSIPPDLWKIFLNYLETPSSQHLVDISPLLLPPGPLDTVRSLKPDEMAIIDQIKEHNPQSVLTTILFAPTRSEQYDSLRKYLGSLSEQVPSIVRILCSLPFPQFNFYTDIWALPYNYFSPNLMERFARGVSIADETTTPVKSVSASSCGFLPNSHPSILSSPWNVIDGCYFMGWLSLPVEREGKKEWIEIQLKDETIGEQLAIVWGPAQRPQAIDVSISRDGTHFLPSSINWKHVTSNIFEPPISYGTFKYNSNFVAIRLEFPKMKKGDVVFIQEIKLNPGEQTSKSRIAPVITPWLWITPEQYPSLRCDTTPIESRLIPWICWNSGFKGIILTPIISWDNITAKAQWTEDFPFQPQNSLQLTSLLYPAKNSYTSSVKLERFRDGMEDFEYLVLLAKKARSEKLINAELYNCLAMHPEQFMPWNITSDDFITELIKKRNVIGYELSNKESPYPKKEKGEKIKEKKESPSISPTRKVQKNFTFKQKTDE